MRISDWSSDVCSSDLNMVRSLLERGVTIILTTHYIEEAEEMADRVGVITGGRLILVEQKDELIKKLGRKTLTLNLAEQLEAVPAELADWKLELAGDEIGRASCRERVCQYV